MPAQLHLVEEEPETARPTLTFRGDARLRLWGAAACAVGAMAFTWLGYAASIAPVLAGPLAAALLLWSAYLLATYAARRSVRYTVSAARLEIERGILGRRVESIELWRVRDVVLDQSLAERLRGVGRITLFSSDQVEPQLLVGPVADARLLFDRLRNRVAAARKDAQVVPLA
ncbi:MAG TPA: PH domain-containing protein [Myxococcales bacterium]|nr:PH domain-containing protein [Myxococcales bacterium]